MSHEHGAARELQPCVLGLCVSDSHENDARTLGLMRLLQPVSVVTDEAESVG